MPSSSATARTSSGATMLALSGPFENTITTLRPGTLAASRRVSSRRVVERRIVAGDRFAQAGDRVVAVARQRGGARQIAAEGVDRHRIGAIQAADEIGDGVRGVDEAAVHVVAGVEQHEHVGADEGVRAAPCPAAPPCWLPAAGAWCRRRSPPAGLWRLRRRSRASAECRPPGCGNPWASGR